MDLRPPFKAALDSFSVPATVTPPGGAPISTKAIMDPPVMEETPSAEFQRTNARRILSLPREDVATVPRGTLIVAPEMLGEANQTWRVDSIERIEPDHYRVCIIPES
jgi:hypothetical protein